MPSIGVGGPDEKSPSNKELGGDKGAYGTLLASFKKSLLRGTWLGVPFPFLLLCAIEVGAAFDGTALDEGTDDDIRDLWSTFFDIAEAYRQRQYHAVAVKSQVTRTDVSRGSCEREPLFDYERQYHY